MKLEEAFPNTQSDENAPSSRTKCPACNVSMERVGRKPYMRALIGSKRYYCWSCHQSYFRFLGHTFPRAPESKQNVPAR